MSKPLRVLHYGAVFGGGGIGVFLLNLYKTIDKDIVQFDFAQSCVNDQVLKTLEAQAVLDMGARIYNLPLVRQHPLKFSKQLKLIMLNNNIDILHCHLTMLTQLIPIKIAAENSIPIIIHSHSAGRYFNRNFFTNMLHTDFIAAADNLTVYTHKHNKKIIDRYKCKYMACSKEAGIAMFGQQAFTVLPNAIPVDKFQYTPERTKNEKNKLNIQDKFVIGHIGRFEFEKNHDFLLDIFASIKKKVDNAVLLLVGDGIGRSSIEEKVRILNLSNEVLFLGNRNDVPDLLQAMDVFILPSRYEGLPLSVVEAQAAGLPCLISDVVGREAKILPETIFISLQKSPADWAEEALKYKAFYRKNTYADVVKAGFDVNGTAKTMSAYYSMMKSRSRYDQQYI